MLKTVSQAKALSLPIAPDWKRKKFLNYLLMEAKSYEPLSSWKLSSLG